MTNPIRLNNRETGFSLPEVVMMILISSTLMIPIIGTLNQSLISSKSFELQKAMQNLAESKMNELVHKGAFLGATLSGETIVASYPNETEVEYHFNVRTEILSNITISDGSTETAQDKKLKAISIEVGLKESEPSIASITLFTLFAEPPMPPDLLYVADPPNKCIFVLNPKTHQKVDVYSTGTETPYFVAVHPSGEWLAIKAGDKVLWMDIRPSSSTVGSYTSVMGGGIMGSHTDETIGTTGYRTARGLVFTSDGNYLYFSYYYSTSSSMKIGRVKIPSLPGNGSLPTFSLNFDGTQWDTSTNQVMDMIRGEDGCIYIALDTTSNANQCIWRINTFTNTMEYVNPDWSVVTAASGRRDEFRGIGTSWDSQEIAAAYDRGAKGVDLGLVLNRSPSHCFDASTVDAGSNADDEIQGMICSRDNTYWLFPLNRAGNTYKLAAIPRSNDGTWAYANDFSAVASEVTRKANLDGFINLKHSPNGKEVIADTYNAASLFFINVKNFIANSSWYSSWSVPAEYSGAKISDVAGRVPEYVWVGAASGSEYMLGAFDVWGGGGNKGRLDENKSITSGLTGSVEHIALTTSGDKAYLAYDNDKKIRMLDCLDNTITEFADWTSDGAQPVKAVWTLDRSLFVLASSSANAVNNPYHLAATATNGLRMYKADSAGSIDNTCDLGIHINGGNGWVVRDIVAMNRRNGVYALFQKTDYSASRMVWIEKSKSRGYSGTEGTLEYKVMDFWDSRYDGFPEGRPWKMVLSPDDSLLAMYDPYGDGTNQTIRIYDLQNNRFPTQPGCAILRYNSNSGSFDAAPLDTPLNLRKALGILKSDTPQTSANADFPFNKEYPFNFHDNSTTCPTLDLESVRFFGYWFSPGSVEGLGYYSSDGVRMWTSLDSSPTEENNSTSAGTSWNDAGYAWGRYNNQFNAKAYGFQGEFFSTAESMEMSTWGYSTAAPTGVPTGISNLSTLPGPVLPTGGATWNVVTSQSTRALKFRPTLLQEILLDGTFRSAGDIPARSTVSDYNSLVSNTDTQDDICFHRDQGRSYLFILDDTNEKLFGLDLFGTSNFTGYSFAADTTNIKNNKVDGSTDFDGLAVSPDGRRLIIMVSKDVSTKEYGLAFVDLVDTTTNTPKFGSGTYCALDANWVPKCMAVRHANSYNTNRDSYSSVALVTALGTWDTCGNQHGVLAKNGIYLAGGADGYDDTANDNLLLIDPMKNTLTAKTDLPSATKLGALVAYDDKLYFLGGKDSGGDDVSTVNSYDIANNTWSIQNPLQEDDNSDFPVFGQAGAPTPYGVVLAGGEVVGQTIPYYKHSITDFSDSTNFARQLIQLNGNARYNGTELEVSYDTVHGSAWITEGMFINANTDFKCFFTAKTKSKDGMTFVVRKNADSDTSLGVATNGCGYRNLDGAVVVDSSIAVLLDTKDNGSGEVSNDYVCIRLDGDLPTGTAPPVEKDLGAGYLGGDTTNVEKITYWWVEYNGSTETLSVFFNTSNNRSSATKAFDYTYDLYSKLGGRIQVGFTAASNTGGGYMRVTQWDLELYETVGNIVMECADFADPARFEAFSNNGDCTMNSNYARLTSSSASKAGSLWYSHPLYFDSDTSFEAKFIYSSNGSNQGAGATFVIQSNGRTQLGGTGDSMGYMGACGNSLAVELDALGTGSGDSDGNHIGILIDGGTTHLHQYGISTTNYNLSGSTLYFWVDYTGSTNSITVRVNNSDNKAGGVATTYTNAQIDLPTRLGGSYGYIGFTGATAASYVQEHNIRYFKLKVNQTGVSNSLLDEAKVYYPHCYNASSSGGLKGDYYNLNPTVTTGGGDAGPTESSLQYVGSQLDSTINFDWGNSTSPFANIGIDQYFIRWQGWVVPSVTDTYTFTTTSDDGVRLTVGGQVLIDEWRIFASTSFSGSKTLTANEAYPIQLDYYEGAGDSDVKLEWSRTGDTTVVVVPSSRLYHPLMGETISMTSLPEAAKDGVLVPHYSRKDRNWTLFYVGAGSGTGVALDNTIASYSFSAGTWTQIELGDDDYTERTGVAACSWGDEIFIFGGARGGTPKKNAIAYNPDNGKYRTLTNFTGTNAVVYQQAVPVGPYIYLIGGATDDVGTDKGTTYVYRYSP